MHVYLACAIVASGGSLVLCSVCYISHSLYSSVYQLLYPQTIGLSTKICRFSCLHVPSSAGQVVSVMSGARQFVVMLLRSVVTVHGRLFCVRDVDTGLSIRNVRAGDTQALAVPFGICIPARFAEETWCTLTILLDGSELIIVPRHLCQNSTCSETLHTLCSCATGMNQLHNYRMQLIGLISTILNALRIKS